MADENVDVLKIMFHSCCPLIHSAHVTSAVPLRHEDVYRTWHRVCVWYMSRKKKGAKKQEEQVSSASPTCRQKGGIHPDLPHSLSPAPSYVTTEFVTHSPLLITVWRGNDTTFCLRRQTETWLYAEGAPSPYPSLQQPRHLNRCMFWMWPQRTTSDLHTVWSLTFPNVKLSRQTSGSLPLHPHPHLPHLSSVLLHHPLTPASTGPSFLLLQHKLHVSALCLACKHRDLLTPHTTLSMCFSII